MRRRRLLAKRIPHIREYLQKAMPMMLNDDVSKQMVNHRVSAFYSVSRMLELFEGILKQEREAHIEETRVMIAKALERKRDTVNEGEMEVEDGERRMLEEVDANMNNRILLKKLQMDKDMRDWRSLRIQDGAAEFAWRLSEGLEQRLSKVRAIREDLWAMNGTLAQVKGVVRAKIDGFRRECVAVREEVIGRAKRAGILGDEEVEALKRKLARERRRTEERKRYLQTVIQSAKELEKGLQRKGNSVSRVSRKKHK